MSTEKPPCPQYQTDAELLKDFLEKVSKAYTCLIFICYKQIIPSMQRSHFYVKDEVEDIVMSALAEVIQKTSGFNSVRSLLWTISTRRLIDWIRKRCRRDEDGKAVQLQTSGINWDIFENVYLQSDFIMTLEFEDRFRHYLLTLTPREAEVLQLLIDGQTEEQIAVILGISVGAVHNIKTRILAKFREFFGDSLD